MHATVDVFKDPRLNMLRCVTSEVKVCLYRAYLEPYLGTCMLSKMYRAWDEKRVYLNFSVWGKGLTKTGI